MQPWESEARIRAALVAAAFKGGAHNPLDVAKLCADEVTLNDEGVPVGVDEAIERARSLYKSFWGARRANERGRAMGPKAGGNPARRS